MDLLNSESVSPNESCVTFALDGNELFDIEAGRLSDISEVAEQETTIIPAIKAEPNVCGVLVVSVIYIYYQLYPQLPAPTSLCPCETRI
jgi:altronate dehydratase